MKNLDKVTQNDTNLRSYQIQQGIDFLQYVFLKQYFAWDGENFPNFTKSKAKEYLQNELDFSEEDSEFVFRKWMN